MKTLLQLALPALMLLVTPAFAQHGGKSDKSKPSSPAMQTSQKITGGATISIHYGAPSIRGREIGKDVEPMEAQVWRLGANDATTFETDKNLSIQGSKLPAGKYALFALRNGDTWTLIFNKVWKTWGAYDYEKNKGSDVVRVDVKEEKTSASTEQLKFTISPDGRVKFNWGTYEVGFKAAVAG